MATFLVRKLDAQLVERLRRRARAHGRSVEAEHREILPAALEPDLSGKDLLELLRQGGLFPAAIPTAGMWTMAASQPIFNARGTGDFALLEAPWDP